MFKFIFLNKKVIVIFKNNREVGGVLQGYDKNGNIVIKKWFETIPLWNLGTAVVRSSHIVALDVVPEEKELNQIDSFYFKHFGYLNFFDIRF